MSNVESETLIWNLNFHKLYICERISVKTVNNILKLL